VARTKDRQRALARAKLERQIARRAVAARRKRQIQAGTAAGLAVVLIVLGALWASGVFSPDKKKPVVAADCAWNASGESNSKDVGRPPTKGITKSGAETMTITTNLGAIDAVLDLSKVPCTAASFAFLSSKDYFKDATCARLTTDGMFMLVCGGANSDGSGGPGYRYKDENLPVAAVPPSANPSASPSAAATVTYTACTIGMLNTGADTNGSQFFIVYKDSKSTASYPIVGTVTKGLDVVQKVGADGVDPGAENKTDGKPKTAVTISSLTLTQPGAAPGPSGAGAGASPAPSTAASTTTP